MILMLTLNTANVWGQTADTITVDSPGTVINTNTALELEVKHNPVKLRGFRKGDGIPADIMKIIEADPALKALYEQIVYLWKQDEKIASGKTTAIARVSEEWSTNLEKLRRQLEEVRAELQNTKADLENQKKSANLAPPPAPANSANDSMLVLRMILDGQLVPKVALDDQAERMAKLPGTKIEVNPNFENIGIGNASDSARVEMSIGSNNGNNNGIGNNTGDSATVTNNIGGTIGVIVKDSLKHVEAKTETVVESRLRKPAGMAFSLRGGKYGILQPEICPVCGTLDLNADTAFFAGVQLDFWVPIANVFGMRGDVSGDYLTGAQAITASGAAFFTLEPQLGNGFSPEAFAFTPIIGFGARANYFDGFQADARLLAGFEAGTQKFGIFATAEKAVVDIANSTISFKTAPERMAAGFYAGPVKLGFMQEIRAFGNLAFLQQKGVTLGVRF